MPLLPVLKSGWNRGHVWGVLDMPLLPVLKSDWREGHVWGAWTASWSRFARARLGRVPAEPEPGLRAASAGVAGRLSRLAFGRLASQEDARLAWRAGENI